MRALLVALAILLVTPPIGLAVIIAGLLGLPDGPNSVYQWGIHSWARIICRAAGAKIRLHHPERILDGPAVYVANHISWFDVFALGAVLPRVTFVAKKELEKLPIFGQACRAAGIVFIERANRRALSPARSFYAPVRRVPAGHFQQVLAGDGELFLVP